MKNAIALLLPAALYVFVIIYSGIKAWNFVDPDGFFRFIGFLILWGLYIALGRFLVVLIVGAVMGIMSKD